MKTAVALLCFILTFGTSVALSVTAYRSHNLSGGNLAVAALIHLAAIVVSIVFLAIKTKGPAQVLSLLALVFGAIGLVIEIPAILVSIAFSGGVPIH